MAFDPPAGNVTGTVDLFNWINSVTEDWFFRGLIIAVYIIVLAKLTYSSEDLGKAFASASFVMMILSVLLRVANLVDTAFMVIFIILTAIGAVWMHIENTRLG